MNSLALLCFTLLFFSFLSVSVSASPGLAVRLDLAVSDSPLSVSVNAAVKSAPHQAPIPANALSGSGSGSLLHRCLGPLCRLVRKAVSPLNSADDRAPADWTEKVLWPGSCRHLKARFQSVWNALSVEAKRKANFYTCSIKRDKGPPPAWSGLEADPEPHPEAIWAWKRAADSIRAEIGEKRLAEMGFIIGDTVNSEFKGKIAGNVKAEIVEIRWATKQQ